ncbi:unnamed protein product [Meganyctiphanes norvegica]|uniref:protein-glutamine gamma-glutamyltransferase n=1 Tax=Meganyctiphanes norvegica TaxID=48144 RepID=A0AAV2QPS7_MEGNR
MPSHANPNRYGSNHANWLSNLRSRTAETLERRTREDDAEESPINPDINRVDRVHWYCKQNARNHQTLPYDLIHDKRGPQAVLRRGQPFYLAIRFKDRDFDLKKDRVVLNFEFGPKASIQKGTLGVVLVQNENFTHTKDEWDVRIDSASTGKDLMVHVFVPASVPVGRWSLKIKTGFQDRSVDSNMSEYIDEMEAYILFNPFCKEDFVYMEEEIEREEYVMNDKGKVFIGTDKVAKGRPWAFGQFEDVVLPVAVYLLDLSKLTDTARANPVLVVRAISAGVNDSDDEGILEGNWSGEYSDGVAPFKWNSSVAIIEKYVKNGFQPVKYGQCWVFSAVTTTICRALGIPCRSVTNYVSAHDTNMSITMDKFFTKEGDVLEYGPDGETYDSIWNFHVWNDVWMARPDLPKGYGGWQAIDATPQEESDGIMQCGPASLEAIRRGDIGLGYDGGFIFAEVNADIKHWTEDDNTPGGWKNIKTNKYHIGRKVMTKKPGKDDDMGKADEEDVIDQYKNKENTAAERLSVHNAIRGIRRAPYYDINTGEAKKDVSFDLIDIEKINIGQEFVVKFNVTNNSDKPRSILAALSAKSIYYTGVTHEMIKKADGKFVLQPKKSQEVKLSVKYSEYWLKLVEGCMVKMYAIGRVQETGQTYTEEDDFMIEKPRLEIKVPEEVKMAEPCSAILTFKNPLDMPLTNIEVTVVGPGLMRNKEIKIADPVPAGGVFSRQIKFKPRIHGQRRKIIATFNAKELYDITGSKTITVKK